MESNSLSYLSARGRQDFLTSFAVLEDGAAGALNLFPKKFVEQHFHQDHKVLTLAVDKEVVSLDLLGSGRI